MQLGKLAAYRELPVAKYQLQVIECRLQPVRGFQDDKGFRFLSH